MTSISPRSPGKDIFKEMAFRPTGKLKANCSGTFSYSDAHAGLEARHKACGRRAGAGVRVTTPGACVVPTRLREPQEMLAEPGLALSIILPLTLSESPHLSCPKSEIPGKVWGEGCSPQGPRCPLLPFLFLLVPTPLSPGSVHGKDACPLNGGQE